LDEARPISIASKLFMSINSVPCSLLLEISGCGWRRLRLAGSCLVFFQYALCLTGRNVFIDHRVLVRRQVLRLELLAGLKIGVFDVGLLLGRLDGLAFVLGGLV